MGQGVAVEKVLKSRKLHLALVSLVLAAHGCALDRTPQLSSSDRDETSSPMNQPGVVVQVPVRSSTDTSGGSFGSTPVPVIPQMAAQTGGLQCGGEFCPFARDPIKPCCTTDADVEQGAARATGRCGLDFRATAATFYGSSCWQRDQLGVADSSCAPLTIQPGLQEAGCCSEQGLCGGLNSSENLGCHYQAGVKPKACGMTVTNPGVTCDPLGIFGVESQVDVWWGGRSGGLVGLTDDGRDKITIHLMVIVEGIDANTDAITGTVKPCGVVLPQFYSTTLCESYDPLFPTTMWDSPQMPHVALSGTGCRHPGCIFALDAKTMLLGIDLNNPESPWPGPDDTATLPCPAGKGQKCFPDHDGDNLPGMTIKLRTSGMAPPGTGCASSGYVFTGAPLNSSPAAIFGGVRRADRVLLGTRTKLGGSSKIGDDCNSGRGTGIAQFVESRAWGCFVQQGTADFPGPAAGANEACQAAEALFLDQNMPIYNVLALGDKPDSKLSVVDTSVSKGPVFSLVRLGKLGDKVTCADVRGAQY